MAAQKKGEAALRKGERAEAAAQVQELKNLHEGKCTALETAPDGIHKQQKVVDELQSADKNINHDNCHDPFTATVHGRPTSAHGRFPRARTFFPIRD